MTSSAPEWVSAGATMFLGFLGAFITVWQWHASGFRPKVSAFLDIGHDAIEVEIVNRGRGGGVIHHVAVMDAQQLAVSSAIEGFKGGFVPTYLPGFATMKLIVMAPENFKFDHDHRVKVDWGKHGKVVNPLLVDVGLYGLPSVLPPSA